MARAKLNTNKVLGGGRGSVKPLATHRAKLNTNRILGSAVDKTARPLKGIAKVGAGAVAQQPRKR